MRLPFDPRKDERNRAKHGCSLADALLFEWSTAVVREDKRFDYPERRYQAIGRIRDKVYFLVFVMTHRPFRPISLRLAEPQEIRLWDAKQAATTPTRTTPGRRPMS